MNDAPHLEFLSILNNEDKALGKDRGILMLVGPTRDVRPLEEACFSDEQHYNSVVTALCTLGASAPENVFGTLTRLLVNKVSLWPTSSKEIPVRLRQFEPDRLEGFRPFHVPVVWEQFTSLAQELNDALPSEDGTEFEPDLIGKVIGQLAGTRQDEKQMAENVEMPAADEGELLSAGQRLVVFLQLDGDIEDAEAWSDFLGRLSRLLPYRAMLVIAGLPDEVKLDPDTDTQRRLTLEPEETSGQEPPKKTEHVVTFGDTPAISDEPNTGDELGRRRYSEALARMVLHKQTKPPLSIGIHGPWGKGKSSFMKQIQEKLDDDDEEEEEGHSKTRIVTVWFNAWSYDDATQVWAGLLNRVSAAIEKKLGHLRALGVNAWHAATHRTAELLWAVALPALVLVAAVSLGWLYGISWLTFLQKTFTGEVSLTDLEEALVPLLGGAGSLLFLLKRLATVTQPISTRIAHFAKLPSYSEELGFQHAVIKDLQFLRKSLEHGKRDARVVVFIDDLDRCSEERIMEILQAIILVLAQAEFFVFLGIDTDMIYRAINEHYTADGKPPARSFAPQYLRKILQLSFHLPPIGPAEREKLLKTFFSEESIKALAEIRRRRRKGPSRQEPGPSGLPRFRVKSSLERETDAPLHEAPLPGPEEMVLDTGDELAAFGDYESCLDDNPREIKRAINIHRLMKFMMQQHGLPEGGWTKQRQRQLVRWVVFCTCWPELVGFALELAERRDSREDVLTRCAKQYASEVNDVLRRERLASIAAKEENDELPAEAVDDSFRFVARSSMLVKEWEGSGTDADKADGEDEGQPEERAARRHVNGVSYADFAGGC